MVETRHFKTVEEFNCGYAGPQTLLLEKKCRELAGRQDDFCLICGDKKAQLFPQPGPKEIHLCPRQFCKKCYYIEAGWKKKSARFKNDIYLVSDCVPLCCTLCWKRGWDIINPLLGPGQPEWQTWTGLPMADVLNRRHEYWEDCAAAKEYEAHFKWRLPLSHLQDDMTLKSDRELLKAIKIPFLKNASRFNRFGEVAISNASPPSGPTFDVRLAFDDTCRRLLNLKPLSVTDEEAEDQRVAEDGGADDLEASGGVEEVGCEHEHEGIEQEQQSPPKTTATRPQRRATRLNFAKSRGVPARHLRSTPQNDMTNSSPELGLDMLDHHISNSGGAARSTLETPRSLQTRQSTQHISRRRGRPQKVSTGPASLPASPSTQGGDATLGPSSSLDDMTVDEDSDNDGSYENIKAMIDHKQKQHMKRKVLQKHQERELGLVNRQLRQSLSHVKKLEEECGALSATESELRHQIATTRAANTALQRTIAESNEEHERQVQTIVELNGKIAQQAEQAKCNQHLQRDIDEYKRRYAGLEADLGISRAREAELLNEVATQHEAYDELQETVREGEARITLLEEENQNFFAGLSRREREIAKLKKVSGTMDRKNRAIRGLREDQDEVMEANKQLRKDLAHVAAELAIDRGVRGADRARMQQTLARGSLPCDVVDRLVQNPFLKTQVANKIQDQAALSQSSSDTPSSQMSGTKRKRTSHIADMTEPSCSQGDEELFTPPARRTLNE